MLRRICSCLLVSVTVTGAAPSPAQAPPASITFDTTQLLGDLRTLAADDMQGRQVGTAGGARARAYIVERFKMSGLTPFGSYEQPFTFSRNAARGIPPSPAGTPAAVEVHGVNVIGRIEGRTQPAQYVVISAHYDHLGTRTQADGRQIVYNGADDNASGTAALFALARYFSTHQPTHSLIFVAFDGEESGHRGSRAFLANPPVPTAAIVMNVNIDMIARDPHNTLFAVGTRVNPFLKPYITTVANAAPVTLLMGHDGPGGQANTRSEDWSNDSDHESFQRRGIPALYLGDEDFDQHHAPTDDYETITQAFYVAATETSRMLVQEFDRNLDAIRNASRNIRR